MKAQFRQFMFGTSIGENKAMNIGWLLFRLHVGLSIAIHAGWPKMNTITAPGWFADQVAGLGFTFPSPAFWAATAAWGEFVGGILIAIGLFTRFAAAQLAFQFFVIAFLWFDKPEPLTGMYFQHLYFWAYVVVAFGGGGKYSVDKLIMNRKNIKIPSPVKIAGASLLLCIGVSCHGQNPAISIADFKPLNGRWNGTLTYLDYSGNTTETIKASIEVAIKNEKVFELGILYSDEPSHNGKEEYRINEDGTRINNRTVIERAVQPDGSLKIVLEEKGTDGNETRPATFHHELMIGYNKFTLTKLVKFDGEANFLQRNQYLLSR
ncbi:MAG: DoxX family protein [Bacteroidota bacterium]|nr:DoxX family protein [Bacteroidota bacterium]